MVRIEWIILVMRDGVVVRTAWMVQVVGVGHEAWAEGVVGVG